LRAGAACAIVVAVLGQRLAWHPIVIAF